MAWLMSPGFISKTCGAEDATWPRSGTWPSGATRSLVFTVAPTALAASRRLCEARALSLSSCSFCASSACAFCCFNSVRDTILHLLEGRSRRRLYLGNLGNGKAARQGNR